MHEIPDANIGFLILGTYRGLTLMPEFPIKVAEVVDNFDSVGNIESFTTVTFSGLRFTTRVEYEED